MKLTIFAALAFLLTVPAFAQDGGYTNVNGHYIQSPTYNQIPGEFNRPCVDGTFSHSEHAQGACSYHGGLAVYSGGNYGGGGGGSCGTGCKAAIGGAAAGTAIAIAIAVHHAHVVQHQNDCEQNLSSPACQKFLFDHPVQGVPFMTDAQNVTAHQSCAATPKGKYPVSAPYDANKIKKFSCKQLR